VQFNITPDKEIFQKFPLLHFNKQGKLVKIFLFFLLSEEEHMKEGCTIYVKYLCIY